MSLRRLLGGPAERTLFALRPNHGRGCRPLLSSLDWQRRLQSDQNSGEGPQRPASPAPDGEAASFSLSPSTASPPSSDAKQRMSLTIRCPSQRTRRSTATSQPSTADRCGDEDGSDGRHDVEVIRSFSHFTEPVKRILLIRNGRSEANDDVSAYVSTPDWRIPLVDGGKRECVEAGRRLAELVGNEPVYMYYSPYIRSRQSLRYVLQGYDEGRQAEPNYYEWWEGRDGERLNHNPLQREGLCFPSPLVEGAKTELPGESRSSTSTTTAATMAPVLTPSKLHDTSLVLRSGSNNRIIGVREDVRLRDGDIGRYRNTTDLIYHLEERERYGKFFYRFPYGESGADVCDRVTSFLDAFQRERVEFPMDTNVVVITHGLTIRMLIKRWFHLTVDTFHKMQSPPSGSIVTLTRLHHRSCFRLDESCVETMNLPLSLNEHNGYKYRNKRLLGSMSSGAPYM